MTDRNASANQEAQYVMDTDAKMNIFGRHSSAIPDDNSKSLRKVKAKKDEDNEVEQESPSGSSFDANHQSAASS